MLMSCPRLALINDIGYSPHLESSISKSETLLVSGGHGGLLNGDHAAWHIRFVGSFHLISHCNVTSVGLVRSICMLMLGRPLI